jgi:epoxyqueuosine reductase
MTTSPTTSPLTQLREAIRAEALRLGFARAGFTTADPLPELQQRRWERWRAEEKAGVMGYLMRETPRRTHPRDLLPEAQTAIVVLAGYYDGDHGAPPEGEGQAGKVARYAWGRDYHLVLREKLSALGAWIEEKCGMRNAECGISLGPRTSSSATPSDCGLWIADCGLFDSISNFKFEI